MALITIDDSSSSSKHLKLESIPLVDLRLFSQSELNSLSHCSNQTFDLHRCDEIVIPKIDRSIFNESAGSRKQTYSRLRLAPRIPDIERRHRRFLSLSKTPQNPIPIDDPEREENKRIVSLLRELFAKDNTNDPGTEIVPIFSEEDEESLFPQPLNVENGIVSEGEKGKGKRGRNEENDPCPNQKGKMEGDGSKAIVAYNQDMVMEIVNCNDVVVDIAALANMDDPFGPELKRRTIGLETEAELLGFLGGLEGKWGSRRKKKRIVNASYFGDHLPKGWKLLIGIRRKGGRMWLNCRQYISPNGLKFVFCKEVSSYLQNVFGAQETNQPNPYQSDAIHRDNKLTSGEIADLTHGDERTREDFPSSPLQSLSTDQENQAVLLRVENLAEVEVKDLLECQKCKKSFVEKDAYLLHLLTSHQSAARCGLRTSVCDGLVTSDGKFECQICHEVFQENHLYNDHIGVHMKNYAESLEALPNRAVPKSGLLSLSGVPSGISNLDESVYIDNSSISQPSAELNDGMNVMDPAPGSVNTQSNSEMNVGSPYRYHDTEGMGSIQQISAAKPNESSPHRKLAVDSKPLSAAKSKCEGCVGSPYSKNIGDDKMDLSVADESCDEQYRGYEIANDKLGEINPKIDRAIDVDKMVLTLDDGAKQYGGNEIADDMLVETNDPNSNHVIGDDKMDLTLAGQSCDKQYRGNEIPDDKLGKTNDPNIDLDVGDAKRDLTLAGKSCDKQYRGNEIADDKLGKTNDPNIDLDVGDDKMDLTLAGESCDKQYRGNEIADDKLGKINDPNIDLDIGDDKMDLTLAGESNDKQYRGYEIANEKLGEIDDPNSNHGIGDDKIDLTLAGESYDKQYGGSDIADDKLREINDVISNHDIGDDTIDLTLAGELCGKQYRGYEIADEKLGGINDPNSNLYVQFNSCLDSASTLGNSEEFGTFKSNDGKYVLGSSISEIDKYTLEQEAGSSCWLTLSCGDQINGVATNNGLFSIHEKNSQVGETRDTGNNKPDNLFGARHSGHDKGVITGTIVSMGENILEDMTSGPSSLLVKSSDRFPTLNLISTQGEDDFYADNQKHEKVSNFQELGLDDMEASKFNNFMTGQASCSVPQEPMDLAYDDADLEQGFGSTSVQFDWDTVLPKMGYSQQQVITTLCVWCGAEFSHEAVNLEIESDSVGFMCPSCKAKISGQLFGIG